MRSQNGVYTFNNVECKTEDPEDPECKDEYDFKDEFEPCSTSYKDDPESANPKPKVGDSSLLGPMLQIWYLLDRFHFYPTSKSKKNEVHIFSPLSYIFIFEDTTFYFKKNTIR